MIYFDIETKTNEEVIKFIPDPSPPGHYKKPETIAKYVEEKRAEKIEKAALDADFGKIVAIGIKEDNGDPYSLLVGEEIAEDNVLTEADAISWFWALFNHHRRVCCGYNIIGFDLPYLLRRSFDLGIFVPAIPNLSKYQTHPTLDLMNVLYNWGQPRGLKFVCERYGIENPLPDLDGSMVKDMDAATLKAYVENDVMLVSRLWNKMLGIYF